MSTKGFASLSKQARKILSAKAGKISQASGAGHKLDKVTAKAASIKGVLARRRKQARAAAIILLEAGFTAEQLHLLDLSEEELIYYGGSKRTGNRMRELLGRLDDVRGDTVEGNAQTAESDDSSPTREGI